MKPFEKRVRALEARQAPEEPLTVEVWIVTPGSNETWLHHSFIAGRPETKRYYEEGVVVGRYVPGSARAGPGVSTGTVIEEGTGP